jgi:hypothetical protein
MKTLRTNTLFLFFLFALTLISCDSKENKKVRAEVMTKLTEDVVVVFDLALNAATAGQGANIVNMILSEEGKQKMIKDNLLPHITKELDKETDIKKLEDLNANKVKRYAFAFNALLKNTDNIKKNLSGITLKIYDGIMDYLKKNNS